MARISHEKRVAQHIPCVGRRISITNLDHHITQLSEMAREYTVGRIALGTCHHVEKEE